MQNLHNLFFCRCVVFPTFYVGIVCSMLTIFLSSCSGSLPVHYEYYLSEESSLETDHSIIFIIHGDNDYLYHDNAGNKYKANEITLDGAIKVAEQNSNAEVFIFHQKPKKHFLFFFPRRDGEFYYYRNGRLITNESYWRDKENSNFELEVEYYRQYKVIKQSKLIKIFLYFGHEIPEFDGKGYDNSYPERAFTVDNLSNGLSGFTSDTSLFDLVILSTCFGGTPYSIDKIGAFTSTIIASPENLHLSYFNFSLLEQLDKNLNDRDVPSFANRFARQSFEILTENVQTEVSVVVYNIDGVQKYLNSVKEYYHKSLMSLKEKTKTKLAEIDQCDCADLTPYLLPEMSEGVNVFYRPARFGPSKQKLNHSGWRCWKYW